MNPKTFEEHSARFCSIIPRVLINAKPKTDDGGDCWTFIVDNLSIYKEPASKYLLSRDVVIHGDRETPDTMDVEDISIHESFLDAIRALIMTHTKESIDAVFETLLYENFD